jgi:hypothetical protein
MSYNFTRYRLHEDIHKTLVTVSTDLEQLQEDYACVVHCIQQRRANFYSTLESEFQVQVITCSGNTVKAAIAKLMLGFPAVIVIRDYSRIADLFGRVGEQAIAGLYAVKKATLGNWLNLATQDAKNLENLIRNDSSHFIYQVDEDAAMHDGLSLEIVSIGADCPSSIKTTMAIN